MGQPRGILPPTSQLHSRQAAAYDSPTCRAEEALLIPLGTPYQCHTAAGTGRECDHGAETAWAQERAYHDELL